MSDLHAQSPDFLAEQFDDLDQQHDADTLGMWVFLATEILLFGGMFTGYTAYRFLYPVGFREGSHHLYVSIGVINTVVLLASSLLVALGVRAIKLGLGRSCAWHLLGAVALGVVFLGLKAMEYTLDYRDHLVPWVNFSSTDPHAGEVAVFLMFYWIMTGIHAVHMLIGVGLLSTIAFFSWRGDYSARYHNPVEISGLYWHFVDIVWIFLLPTLYLLSPHVRL